MRWGKDRDMAFTKRKFAFLPAIIRTGERNRRWIWLEWYWVMISVSNGYDFRRYRYKFFTQEEASRKAFQIMKGIYE